MFCSPEGTTLNIKLIYKGCDIMSNGMNGECDWACVSQSLNVINYFFHQKSINLL